MSDVSDEAVVEIPVLCFRWRVDIWQTGGCIMSPAFRFQGAKWRLSYGCDCINHYLRLNRTSEGFSEAFSVTVHVEGGGTEKRILSELTMTRRLEAGDEWNRFWTRTDMEVHRSYPKFAWEGVLRFRVVMMADDSVPLTVCRQLRFRFNTGTQTPLHASHISCLEGLSDDLAKLMLDQDSGPDVEFQCAGHSIRAHSSVLSARSPVISSMLASDMVEGRTKVVRIPDVEPDVFQKFLKYLYSGKVEELTYESSLSLYEVGDQYAVQGLPKRCSDFLMEHLTVQNACEVLAVADAHSDAELVEAVVQFMVDNKVLQDDDLRSTLFKNHLGLFNKFFERFFVPK